LTGRATGNGATDPLVGALLESIDEDAPIQALTIGPFFAAVVAPLFAALNNRIILGAIFYLLLTPAGLAMRLFGRDTMKRGFDESLESYFVPVERQADAESFREIF